jgi:hypothetical protein
VFVALSGSQVGDKRFADDAEAETELRKWLRQQSKDFYAAGFDALLKLWDKCINVGRGYVEKYVSPQVRISHVLRFISIRDLFTDSPLCVWRADPRGRRIQPTVSARVLAPRTGICHVESEILTEAISAGS